MGRLIVVTAEDQVSGYRMAGVTSEAAASPEEALQIVSDIADAREGALVAVDESLLAGVDPAARRKLEESMDPIVVSIPSGTRAGISDRRARLSEVLRRAVGFRIRFPGEEG
jgi:vacuolar-type H+-ATPase subunit F/Vma7